jgi:diguanylate cyclase (GGDEF)-like protein
MTAARYHARPGVVIPIGIIVVVAIASVVIAVLGSARRADEVALATERHLFARALHSYGDRMQREIEAVATSEAAYARIRVNFDIDWIERNVGQRLQSYFDHHFVFIADPTDKLLYATAGNRRVDPAWFNSVRDELAPALDQLRGRTNDATRRASTNAERDAQPRPVQRVTRVQTFLGRPAIIAAIAVTRPGEDAQEVARKAPIAMTVKLIDGEVLTEVAAQLRLHNLRQVGIEAIPPGDYFYGLSDPQGRQIAAFVWTPKQPGAEIVNSIIPFVIIAVAGILLLGILVLRHMRRTAVTIASGESRLRHLALHDSLCGLPNRTYFSERLEAVIKSVRNGSPPAALLYIDLDHFKDVNDTLGHPVGDELIRAVTQRLTNTIRDNDLVARIGGDEFAVITSGGSEHAALLNIANRLISTICTPYTINNQTIVIGASIGIAVITEKVGVAADIMRHADMALYRAKNEGRNRACIYDTAMDTDLLKRKSVENDLRLAIERDEIRLVYQPIVNNSGETVIGVEALCRWTHPDRGEIPPSEFIPIAENSGLIISLGEWVLRRACIDGNAWPKLIISVNVSALQFRRADFVDVVERILADTEFDPTRLELEVTESTLIGNVETAELAMFRLKALGVRLALDDFGTGYSSLLYLRRFPFDKLKIDRSFVHSIERASDAAAIVHAVVSLGRGLGMKVTAEGVETAEQHLFLRAAGIHFMQGYRFGRPSPVAEISKRLNEPGSFKVSDEIPGMKKTG